MPEVLMVSLTLLCEIKYTIIGGIIMITDIAMAEPDRANPPDAMVEVISGKVFIDSVKMVPDPVMVHISRKANNAKVSHAGFTSGNAMRKKILNCPAPSI